jgi:hypothetical protein
MRLHALVFVSCVLPINLSKYEIICLFTKRRRMRPLLDIFVAMSFLQCRLYK